MNWYKIAKYINLKLSQLVELDDDGVEVIEGHHSYLNFGHEGWTNVKQPIDIMLWNWDKNGLNTIKTNSKDSHSKQTGMHSETTLYSGRYVIKDKILTVVRENRLENVPSWVIQELKFKFKPSKIYIY